jgi:hypothetical protein
MAAIAGTNVCIRRVDAKLIFQAIREEGVTRLFVSNDGFRLCSSDARRLVTTEDCAQAASEAAARATANS